MLEKKLFPVTLLPLSVSRLETQNFVVSERESKDQPQRASSQMKKKVVGFF